MRTTKAVNAQSSALTASERTDQLVQLCDYCSAAHRIADANGEKLLAYLLAMAIQEGQTALRRLTAAQAATQPK